MTSPPSAAVQKALTKLEASLAAGQPYEGHEMFKTVFHRFRARRQLEDSYALAAGGASLQFLKGQPNCGTELASMLVDAFAADAADAGAQLPRLLRLLGHLPTRPPAQGADPPVEAGVKVAAAALKWLHTVGGEEHVPEIEGALAAHITRCLGWAGLGAALPHYARSADLPAFAAALAAAAAQGAPAEEDLFLTRAVLHTAAAPYQHSLGDQVDRARGLLAAYAAAAGAGRALPSTPLMHFVDLLLCALERESDTLVQVLLERYRPALDRDPSLAQLVARCREEHVGPLGGGGGGGGGAAGAGLPPMFGNLLQMLSPPPAS